MSRRVFLDVGANTGQTLAAVLDLPVDWIVCFEPASSCWPYLQRIADKRVTVERFGLWSVSRPLPLFEPGRKGASLWAKDYARSPVSQICDFRNPSDWFRENITHDDVVWLKMNCEGAEYDILSDLLTSGEFAKVTHVLLSPHAIKIPVLRDVADRIEALFGPFKNVTLYGDIPSPTHKSRIRHWVESTMGGPPLLPQSDRPSRMIKDFG